MVIYLTAHPSWLLFLPCIAFLSFTSVILRPPSKYIVFKTLSHYQFLRESKLSQSWPLCNSQCILSCLFFFFWELLSASSTPWLPSFWALIFLNSMITIILLRCLHCAPLLWKRLLLATPQAHCVVPFPSLTQVSGVGQLSLCYWSSDPVTLLSFFVPWRFSGTKTHLPDTRAFCCFSLYLSAWPENLPSTSL